MMSLRKKISWFFGASVVLGLFLIMAKIPIARANIYLLYANSCLGGWENTERATKAPDVNLTTSADFSDENSAKLSGDVLAQIYCGNFSGEIADATIPKKIIVNFSWTLRYPEPEVLSAETEIESIILDDTDSHEPVLDQGEGVEIIGNHETGATSSPQTNQETDTFTDELVTSEINNSDPTDAESSTTLEIPNEPVEINNKPDPDIETNANDDPELQTSLIEAILNPYIKQALAQELTDLQLSTTTNNDKATTTENFDLGDILKISYTLNGVDWNNLGYANRHNYQDQQFEIPIDQVADWENISKIQIAIENTPAADSAIPIIYLDAVWLEVSYEALDIEAHLTGEVLAPFDETSGTQAETTSEDEEEFITAINEDSNEIIPLENKTESPPRALSTREFSRAITVDPQAPHECRADLFRIDISSQRVSEAVISLKGEADYSAVIEIGGLPQGIDIRFASNNDYLYEPKPNETKLRLNIVNELGSQKGNFSVPIIYTLNTTSGSATICQINVINNDTQ